HFLLSLTFLFLTATLAFSALLTALLLIFARRFSVFFRSGFLRYRRVLLLVAAVTTLLIAGLTRFTAFTVLTWFTVVALAIVTAFTALFTL
ncbi:hypothetical protein, partial [Serratia marcescens]|uniref:hypothetical protein n=1 Tax=Serratia marcescens TaxID=615 RepID=UPI002380302B